MNPIITALLERSSTNLFDSARGLDDARIEELVRLATTAPSAFNLQNWRFIAVRSSEAKARLRAQAWDQAKVTEAAVTFILVGQLADYRRLPERLMASVDAGFMPSEMVAGWQSAAQALYADQPQRQRDEAVRSATFAGMTLVHAAQAYDLGASPMIGFDPEGVAQAFGLGPDEVPVMLLAVGYALDGNWPQKPRRPLAEVLSMV